MKKTHTTNSFISTEIVHRSQKEGCDAAYNKMVENCKEKDMQRFVQYFDKEWWSKKTRWARCWRASDDPSGTNCIESYHRQLKDTIFGRLDQIRGIEKATERLLKWAVDEEDDRKNVRELDTRHKKNERNLKNKPAHERLQEEMGDEPSMTTFFQSDEEIEEVSENSESEDGITTKKRKKTQSTALPKKQQKIELKAKRTTTCLKCGAAGNAGCTLQLCQKCCKKLPRKCNITSHNNNKAILSATLKATISKAVLEKRMMKFRYMKGR
jgi:hypothetical protein